MTERTGSLNTPAYAIQVERERDEARAALVKQAAQLADAQRERNDIEDMDNVAMDKMQAMIQELSERLATETDYAGSCRRALCQIASLGESSMSDTEAIQAAMDIAVTALAKNPVNAEPSASTQSAGTTESALNPGPHSEALRDAARRNLDLRYKLASVDHDAVTYAAVLHDVAMSDADLERVLSQTRTEIVRPQAEDTRSCDEQGKPRPDKYCRMGQCEVMEKGGEPCKCWTADQPQTGHAVGTTYDGPSGDLLCRIESAAANFEGLAECAHDATLTTTACAMYGRVFREAAKVVLIPVRPNLGAPSVES